MSGRNPRLKEFASHTLKRTNKYPIYRIGYELAAWLTPLFVIAFLYLFYVFFHFLPAKWMLYLIGLGLVGLFVRFRTTAKRYAIDTQRAIMSDERAPILYLRSFKQDGSGDRRRDYPKKTELKLTSALNQVGPVVAVGQPGEELPPLGASRLYFDNREWKDRVKELMSISNLVVIHPSSTTGVEWEMATAKQILAPERVVFVLASWLALKKYGRQIEYEILVSQMRDLFGVSLPDNFDGAYFLYFAEDWAPRFSRPPWHKRWLFTGQSVVSLQNALNPIFQNITRVSAARAEQIVAGEPR